MKTSIAALLSVLALLLAAGARAGVETSAGTAGEVAATSANPSEPAPPDKPHEKGWKPVAFRLDSSLRLGHESNLFQVQERREAAFSAAGAQYERFYRMEGPADIGAHLALGLGWRWKHASKRSIGVGFRSRQHSYARNAIANYSDFELSSSFGLTRRDTLRLGVTSVPRRFRENHRVEAFPGIFVFERADAREKGVDLAYEREWTKAWSTTIGVGSSRRDFETPFDARDEKRRSWSVAADHRFGKRVALGVEIAGLQASTPAKLEAGIVKDRSHDDLFLSLDVDLKLAGGWRLTPSANFRVRDYTTSVMEDLSRFDRTDRRRTFGIEAAKRLGKSGWSVSLDASQVRNRSGRQVTDVTSDELSYENVTFGVGVGYRR